MANQRSRKRRLEEKLGLNQGGTIKSGFDQEIVDNVWDMMTNNECNDLREYPLIKQDRQSWPNWFIFLVAHEGHAAIWAIDERHMNRFEVVDLKSLSRYDVRDCLKPDAIVRRFHVVVQEDEHYCVETDELRFQAEELQSDSSLYVGTLELSFKGLKVLMAVVADRNDVLEESDCLKYCEQLLPIYFGMNGMNVSQSTIEDKMTDLKRHLVSERKRVSRKNRSSHGHDDSMSYIIIPIIGVCIVGFVIVGVAVFSRGSWKSILQLSELKPQLKG